MTTIQEIKDRLMKSPSNPHVSSVNRAIIELLDAILEDEKTESDRIKDLSLVINQLLTDVLNLKGEIAQLKKPSLLKRLVNRVKGN